MRSFIRLFILTVWLAPGALLAAEAKAYFAGGCFWCMTPPFEKLPGVLKVTAGYADGKGTAPTYGDYAEEGFTEAVEVDYDPAKVTYDQLLGVFWKNIDPTDAGGQFVDRGPQYRTAIFYLDAKQKEAAERSKRVLDRSSLYDKPVVTPVEPFTNFYPAEDYHQDFYKKNPMHYQLYHQASGRVQFLERIWGKDKH